jgi:hypothetical protein
MERDDIRKPLHMPVDIVAQCIGPQNGFRVTETYCALEHRNGQIR